MTALSIALCSLTAWSAETDVPDRDLRESAERIHADPAFRGLERFPQATEASPAPQSSSSSEKSATSSDEGNAKPQPSSNWWDRLRPKGKTSDKKADGSATSSGSDGQPADGSGTRTDPSTGESRPDAGSKPETEGQKSQEVTRPQRPAADKSPPSQRGHDGVTRPVRFAPKVRTPPPKGPEWNWNLGWLSGFGSLLGQLLHVGAYAALVAVCVLILVLVARALSEQWRSRPSTGGATMSVATPLAHDRSPGETEADVFLREALRLAERGEHRPALGQLVLGAMSVIERRQWIRYRRGLTLNDYVRSVRSRPEQLTGLRSVIDSYEPVEFGRRSATETVFATALAGYRHAFVRVETSTG
ncbi:MAG: hypothetical protein SH850_17760 [Planctomycetaceae bacterium]|nr:hypothetical protein [Planctomycetaceae bacterium]